MGLPKVRVSETDWHNLARVSDTLGTEPSRLLSFILQSRMLIELDPKIVKHIHLTEEKRKSVWVTISRAARRNLRDLLYLNERPPLQASLTYIIREALPRIAYSPEEVPGLLDLLEFDDDVTGKAVGLGEEVYKKARALDSVTRIANASVQSWSPVDLYRLLRDSDLSTEALFPKGRAKYNPVRLEAANYSLLKDTCKDVGVSLSRGLTCVVAHCLEDFEVRGADSSIAEQLEHILIQEEGE